MPGVASAGAQEPSPCDFHEDKQDWIPSVPWYISLCLPAAFWEWEMVLTSFTFLRLAGAISYP